MIRFSLSFFFCCGWITVFSVIGASVHGSENDLRPVLREFCFECHGAEKQKGELRLDTLAWDFNTAERWQDVLDQIKLDEMPPPKARQPSAAQGDLMIAKIEEFLREAAKAKRFAEGRVSLRRLTNYEYANTMRDLLRLDRDYARELPPDPPSRDGFFNNGETLEMSPPQIEAYLRTARQALDIAVAGSENETAEKRFRYHQTESAKGRLPNRKDGGHAPVRPEFVLDLPEFPRRGDFEIRVVVKLANPDQADFPMMSVSLGHVPGIIHVPRKIVGEVELDQPGPVVYTFRGRMEDFPQAGPIPFGNSGFKGMIAMIDFFDGDGKELRYPDKTYAALPSKPKGKQKGKREKPKPAQPPKNPPPFGSRIDAEVVSAEFRGPLPRKCILQSRKPREEIASFAQRAFRRPISNSELKGYLKLYRQFQADSKSFDAAIRETFAAILVSPHFLYISESSQGDRLSDFEIATRLSYFLWSSMPDEALFALARQGKLSDPNTLRSEVERILQDPKSGEFIKRFVSQWFDLDALHRVAVDPNSFPGFKESLKGDFRGEVHAVFSEIFRNDLSALELLDSSWSMINRDLAKHYGIRGPRSSRFERVIFPEGSARGGLLGQGALHLAGSNGDQSHPIKRAVWLLDRLLDSPPASPPPDTPELESDDPGFATLPLKKQLELHRKKESCNNCHRKIDPWGIPLENFDALGQWREVTSGESTSVLPCGTPIDGPAGLKEFLIQNRHSWFARSAVKRLAAYALGRSLDLGDRECVENLVRSFEKHGYRFGPLIADLVTSEVFLIKGDQR